MLNFSTSEENYLKAICHLQGDETVVTTNELARELRTQPASVTDMMKKLKAKKLLHYQPYRGFRLTAEGKKVALGIVRRHRLWEFFLAEKLKFSWDEVHAVAEELEHVGSKILIEKLDQYLGYPRFDPHGDPIPDSNGKIESPRQLCITALGLNKPAQVCNVGNQSKEMLELLRHNHIGIGTRLEVLQRFQFDQSIEIKIRKQKGVSQDLPPFVISHALAENIFVTQPTRTLNYGTEKA